MPGISRPSKDLKRATSPSTQSPGSPPASFRGAAGLVTDGALRDSPAIATLDFPSYAAGAHGITSGMVNTLFLETRRGVVVVDAPPDLDHRLLQGIEEVVREAGLRVPVRVGAVRPPVPGCV